MDVHDDLAAALAPRYELERELGHGGMAIVYLARDVRHSRHVAVKVLRPDIAAEMGGERFLREIGVAARLAHHNIVALFDSGGGNELLYYVMPYVEGETLRARLDREHQLPIPEALAIAGQVAAALDYAHAHGVVHRDVKPENILIAADGHVCVADFGLARALDTATSRRLTDSRMVVGTAEYMSPEQAAGDPIVDGRADVYSLGCVVYEMLIGTPPFASRTPQGLLKQHLTAPVPSICAERTHCPPELDAAVRRAMEKLPADRFRTAGEMVRAMTPASPPPDDTTGAAGAGAVRGPARTARPGRRALVIGVPIGLAVLVVAAALALGRGRAAAPSLDASAIAVIPFVTRDGDRDTSTIADRVADALAEWDGVRVLGAARVGPLTATPVAQPAATDDPLGDAAAIGAGRALVGETTAGADSVEVRLALWDVASRQALGTRRITVPAGRAPSRGQLRVAVNALLRDRAELPWLNEADETRPSLPAWRAYDRARDALASWDVPAALDDLRAAVAAQPDLAPAHLWLAMAEQWSLLPASVWRPAARRAVELTGHLAPRDSLAAAAHLALAEGRYPEACAAFERLIPLDSTGVIGWFGLGECQRFDPVLLRDARSPSGYRFRSSYESAVRAYMHIVTDRPPPQPAFVYTRLAEVLYTAGNQMRTGRAADRPGVPFFAYPSLEGDTLALVPYPYDDRGAQGAEAGARHKAEAIDRNRGMLRRLYSTWAESAPSSVDAHLALATLLEATEQLAAEGQDLSALREIRRARALAASPARRRLLARSEARLLLKSGRFGEAAAFVDSLFAATPQLADDTAGTLLGAAALSGRVRATAQLFEARGGSPNYPLAAPNGQPLELPPAVLHDAAEAFAFAAAGACVERLRTFPARIDTLLTSYVADSARRTRLRATLLRWPLRLAVPCLGAAPLAGIDAGNDDAVIMEKALARGDTAALRAEYRRVMAARPHDRPGDVSIDATYLEAWLLAAIGDTSEATAHLDRSLEALPTLGPYLLTRPSESAAMVRAMGLRAELADATGDRRTAARWAAAVASLWAHGDPEVRPYVARMRAIARAPAETTPRTGS